jgi:hypothetical protein
MVKLCIKLRVRLLNRDGGSMTDKFEETHPLSFLGYTLEEHHVGYCTVQESINAALFLQED